MHVIGTAGHVDHGKSAIVAALTGTHPDRLQEEIKREMSIDLGFAWLNLPVVGEIGIIDVPGHRDFIENMLSGVGGIDSVIFVIAADEGIMPQTQEHLDILDLLQVKTGIIALNKIDLVEDKEWLDLVELDIRDHVKGTVLEESPIVRISAKTGYGIDQLKDQLIINLTLQGEKIDIGKPRLPVDRIFSLPGFGTIVTGTLSDGCFKIGDEVEVIPIGLRGRIRNLQTHKHKQEIAYPGSRTAININGVNKDQVERGFVITHPNDYLASNIIDTHFRLLKNVKTSLKHNMEVKLFIGAAEILATCRVLGKNEIEPGSEGFLQLQLRQPSISIRGDRFILRRPSPSETLGGGIVLYPNPKKIHRRFNSSILNQLETQLKGDPFEIILQKIEDLKFTYTDEIIKFLSFSRNAIELGVSQLITENKVLEIYPSKTSSNPFLCAKSFYENKVKEMISILEGYHKTNPLKTGMTKENLKTKLNLNNDHFDLLILKASEESFITVTGSELKLNSHNINFSEEQQRIISTLINKLELSPFTPPGIDAAEEFIGKELLRALFDTKKLFQVDENIFFLPKAYHEMSDFIEKTINQNGSISLSEVRDHFQTSRKFALAVLEYMDRQGITKRQGDLRILRTK